MTKYITVKLTEDQFYEVCRAVELTAERAELNEQKELEAYTRRLLKDLHKQRIS